MLVSIRDSTSMATPTPQRPTRARAQNTAYQETRPKGSHQGDSVKLREELSCPCVREHECVAGVRPQRGQQLVRDDVPVAQGGDRLQSPRLRRLRPRGAAVGPARGDAGLAHGAERRPEPRGPGDRERRAQDRAPVPRPEQGRPGAHGGRRCGRKSCWVVGAFFTLTRSCVALFAVPVERYLSFFSWDEAKHPHRRPLPEIVSIIHFVLASQSVGKIEDELKQLSTRYAEKKQQLIGLQRKKGGNLMVANLNDVLTPDVVSTSDFVNTEYLQTMVVIVPKNLEEQWLQEYAQIGDQIAEYGPKGNRGNVRGSPVVPGSSRKLMEEGDSAVYTVTLLKGQYQPGFVDKEGNFEPGTSVDYIEDFKTRAKEKRFVVREFNFDPTSHASNEEAIAELEVEVDRLWSALIRWCKAHFGETFIAWMHIKMVRVFVESVLRYGLPVNFVVAMYKVRFLFRKDKKLRAVLSKKYAHLQPAQFSGLEEGSSGSSQVEYYPYVTNAFHPLSTT
ncbi:hypothetical protein ON010_g3053 [Phytophthora cinnamomi]|nr:hypothetical protein ON010_g3053 [Phytophthora cinnamomi]